MRIDIKNTIKKFNIRPVKSLGQNFLTDDDIIVQIVEAANISKNDLVIEIGPGLGSMTAELAERAGWVAAVEIDRHLMPVLQQNLKAFTNISLINKDILKADIKADIIRGLPSFDSHSGCSPLKVVANLPYYITTPVIMKCLEEQIEADEMVFMVQKEVADRITASPGGKEYGALSVAVQFYSKPTIILEVPPDSFIPRPAVNSSVIKLEIYKSPIVEVTDREMFFKTVKAAFGQRRKTLVNALCNSGYFKAGKDEIKDILKNIGIEADRRGETLSILQFAELANSFSEKNN